MNREDSVLDAERGELPLGDGVYRPNRLELVLTGKVTRLSHKEAQILTVLFQHRNRPLDRTKLLHLVWGDDSFFHSRNLDVYIRKLRQCLEAWRGVEIITLKGIGYQFVVPENETSQP